MIIYGHFNEFCRLNSNIMLISEADVLNDVSKPSKPVEISSSQLLSEITKGSEECFISAWIFRLKLLTKFVGGNWDLNLTDKAL